MFLYLIFDLWYSLKEIQNMDRRIEQLTKELS